MTFYRTPQRQSFDANIFEESMVDYGEQVAVQEDLGAIGGMLGYGNIYHYPNFDDLPGGTYMTGSAEQVVGISGNRSSFPGVGVSAEQNSNDYWGLRILDAGVWKVTVNFRCTPASGDTWFQVSTTHDPKYASADTANRRTIAYGNFSERHRLQRRRRARRPHRHGLRQLDQGGDEDDDVPHRRRNQQLLPEQSPEMRSL